MHIIYNDQHKTFKWKLYVSCYDHENKSSMLSLRCTVAEAKVLLGLRRASRESLFILLNSISNK